MATMLAARYLGPHRIEAQTVTVPAIGPGEALVQVDACGLCGSDLNILAGTHPRAKAPLIPGHELSGRIVQLQGDARGLQHGDRVTVFPLISCGHCYACTHDIPHICRNLRLYGFDVDGGMAEFIRLPIASLIRLPDTMPTNTGALIEPLAVAVHGVRRIVLAGVETAVVLGSGPIGLLTAFVATLFKIPRVLISDVQPARVQLANKLGLTALEAGASLRQQVMEMTDGNGADVVFECAGHPSSAAEMTALVRSRGAIVNLGVFKKRVEVDMQAINFREIELFGSRVYERCDFETAITIAGDLPLDGIVSHAFTLAEVSRAFAEFQSSEACKVLILPSEGVP